MCGEWISDKLGDRMRILKIVAKIVVFITLSRRQGRFPDAVYCTFKFFWFLFRSEVYRPIKLGRDNS